MLWLSRPPFLRWMAAGALAAVALALELAPEPSISFPMVVTEIAAGSMIGSEDIAYRPIPDLGLTPGEPGSAAVVDLAPGDPLMESLTTTMSVPDGWSIIAVDVPVYATPGQVAHVVLLPPNPGGEGDEVAAVIAAPGTPDAFGGGGGAIAVPPDSLRKVAIAAAEGRLVIAVTPTAPR